MKKSENRFFSHENWEYILTKLIQKRKKNEVEDIVLSEIERAFEDIDGAALLRNVESADMLYVTVAHGEYQAFLHEKLSRSDGFSGYGLSNRKVYAVNSIDQIPTGVKPYGRPFTESDRVLVIPLIPTYSIISQPPKIPAVVVLHRTNKDFTIQEVEKAKNLSQHFGYLLDIYHSSTLMLAMRHIENLGRQMISDATLYNHSISAFLGQYLQKAIEHIEGAEAGSLLIEVPGGFKFIAVSGYPESLLEQPPISKENHLQWYYYGELKLKQGMPRILTRSIIEELLDRDIVVKVSEKTLNIQSSLGIPIVGGGRVVLFINLDSFSSPVAFDDTDIELARTMGTYFTAAYEILTKTKQLERRNIIIRRINTLAEHLTHDDIKKEDASLKEAFSNVLYRGLKILKPITIMLLREKYIDTPFFIGPEDSGLYHKVLKLKHHTKSHGYTLATFKKKNLLIIYKPITIRNMHVQLYTAIIRDEIWSRADLDYVSSVINSASIYIKNLVYLRAIRKTQEETLKMLGKALELRDIETKGHTDRTANLSIKLASAIGFPDIKGILWGAFIHDIGKIAIPDSILLKPSKLSPAEFDIIKKHVLFGFDLIKHIEGLPETTKNIVLFHHEKWDGTGYMKGLKADQIPIEARIFAIVDVFDALLSPRPYKQPWPIDKALSEIKNLAGTHFDPQLVDIFMDIVKDH